MIKTQINPARLLDRKILKHIPGNGKHMNVSIFDWACDVKRCHPSEPLFKLWMCFVAWTAICLQELTIPTFQASFHDWEYHGIHPKKMELSVLSWGGPPNFFSSSHGWRHPPSPMVGRLVPGDVVCFTMVHHGWLGIGGNTEVHSPEVTS